MDQGRPDTSWVQDGVSQHLGTRSNQRSTACMSSEEGACPNIPRRIAPTRDGTRDKTVGSEMVCTLHSPFVQSAGKAVSVLHTLKSFSSAFSILQVEKILQMLLLLGMSKNTDADQFKLFKRRVSACIDTEVLKRNNVDPLNPRYTFPENHEKKGHLIPITLSGNWAKKFANNFAALALICTEKCSVSVKEGWQDVCVRFQIVYGMIHSKLEFGFNFDMLAYFVNESDELCDAYFKLTSYAGNTNYWHCLQAGHFAEQLERLGNLYRLSQQGWENLNGTLSKTYHRKSNKGGGKNNDEGLLLPLVEAMSRNLLWPHGHLDRFLKKNRI